MLGHGPTLSPFPAESLGATRGTGPLGRWDGYYPALLQLPVSAQWQRGGSGCLEEGLEMLAFPKAHVTP